MQIMGRDLTQKERKGGREKRRKIAKESVKKKKGGEKNQRNQNGDC